MTLETWSCAEVHSKIWFVWAKHFPPLKFTANWYRHKVMELWQCNMSEIGAENSEISTTNKMIEPVIPALQGPIWMQHEYDVIWGHQTNTMGGKKNSTKMMWKWLFVNGCECQETNISCDGISILIPSWEKFFYVLGVMLKNNDILKERKKSCS